MASGGSLNITEEDPHCTPCVSKGKKVEFYKYCLDCEAHYCAECFELHPRVPFLAKHTVLSKDDEKRWSRIPYKCKTHGRTIEFFCTIHNKLVCQICINLQHRKCELDFIPECSKEISTNRKLTSTVERISKIIETARSYEENFEKKSQTNQYSKQSFLKTLSDFRYSINGMLDGLEQVTTKSMEQRFEENATYFNASIAELRKLKNELEELKSELTTTSKEKEVLVFIRYTEGIEMVKEAEKKIAELNNKSNKEQFTLVINGKLEQLLKSLKSFGSIIDEQSMASDDGSLSESVVEVLSTKRTLSSSNDNQAGIHILHPSNQSEKEPQYEDTRKLSGKWMRKENVKKKSTNHDIGETGRISEQLIHENKCTSCDRQCDNCTCVITEEELLIRLQNYRITAKPVEFVLELKDKEVQEGDRVLLVCETSKEESVTWKKYGSEFTSSKRCSLETKDAIHALKIAKVKLEDGGTYTAHVGNKFTSCTLKVKAIPVNFDRKLKDTEVEEGEYIVLECKTSTVENVTWKKDGSELTASGERWCLEKTDTLHKLIISKAQFEDEGKYTAHVGQSFSACSVRVKAKPVEFVLVLKDKEVQEGDRVLLECETSKEESVTWTKDGSEFTSSGRCSLETTDAIHKLKIAKVKLEDGGTYTAHVGNKFTSCTLKVKAIRVNFDRKLKDIEVQEGENIVLECKTSMVENVTWKKDGSELTASERLCLEKTDTVHKLIISKAQLEEEGKYTAHV